MVINYLTAFNYGYIEFAKNNLYNYVNVLEDGQTTLTMVAFDKMSYDEIKSIIDEKGFVVDLRLNELGINDAHNFNTPGFISIDKQKTRLILEFMEDHEVTHFFDSDVYFFKNPRNLIEEKIVENDMVFQQDSPRVHNHLLYSNYVCLGNFTVKNTEKSKNLIRKVIELANPRQNDQEIIYEYLLTQCPNIKEYKLCTLDVYDPDLFQNGFDTFQGGFHSKPEKVAVHANHMEGKQTKLNMLKSIGAWDNSDSRKDVGVLIIATNRYNDFLQPLISSADEHLLADQNVTYFVFTNEDINIKTNRKLVINRVEHSPWPWMTLGRYFIFEHFSQQLSGMDYLFYCDADMRFVGKVGDEILSERVATQHPGYKGGRGTPETRPDSTACVYDHEPMQYFAGGFNGGTSAEYLKMAVKISANIRKDLEKNIIAVWHDESHMNRYFIDVPPTKVLDPSYCCPEPWVDYPDRKLLALEKEHNKIRN